MASTGVSRIEGVDPAVAIKAPCRAATISNITLSGLQTIDGIVLVADDRVLVREQTDQTENGIYLASETAWTRADDFDGARDIVKGTLVSVTGGSNYAQVTFRVTTNNPIVIGTSNIVFATANATDVTQVISTSGIDTYEKIRALTPGLFSIGDVIYCSGDGIAGNFKVATGSATDNGGTIITNATWNAASKHLKRVYTGRAKLIWFCEGDGVTDDRAGLLLADAIGEVSVSDGTFLVGSNATLTAEYHFEPGGIIKSGTGVTITMSGSIEAGDYQIFDDPGAFVVASSASKIDEIKCIWFGMTLDDTTEAVSRANMSAIKQALAMGDIGVPTGLGRNPLIRLPNGFVSLDASTALGTGANVGSYQRVLGYGDNTYLSIRAGADAFDLFTITDDGANSWLFDDFQVDGNYTSQTSAQRAIVINPTTSPAIYGKIGPGVYIKEMNDEGIAIIGAGADNCDITPFMVRDSNGHNLYISACDRLRVGGRYRSAKTGFSGVVFDSTEVATAYLQNTIIEDNASNGLYVTNINSEVGKVTVNGGSISRNGAIGALLDRAYESSLIGVDIQRNANQGVELLNTLRTKVKSCDIHANKFQGIRLGGSSNCDIIGNDLDKNSDTNVNTYSAIFVYNNSDDNTVSNNKVRNTNSTQKYGIEIDGSTENNNVVHNNDVKGSGNTGTLLDSGTNTILYDNYSGNNLASSATLSAGSVAVTFSVNEPSANYMVVYESTVNETFYTTSKTTGGFTINSSVGASTATVKWRIVSNRAT